MNKPTTIKLTVTSPLQADGKEYGVKDTIEMPLRQAQALAAASVAVPADSAAEKALAAADAKSQANAADDQSGS